MTHPPHSLPTVDVVTMGCSKNLVDSERLLGGFRRAGIEARHNPTRIKADYAVVNTCGFIGDAKEESIEMILQLIGQKQKGNVGKVMVMGCLSERYVDELKAELPEVDAWYGKYDWHGIVSEITGKPRRDDERPWNRVITTAPHSAYLKISEGCNRRCAFCAIPLITGPHRSRQMQEIVDEANVLARNGVKELNVIAQDLSSYGLDLNHCQQLPALIDTLADVPGIEWIRLHYAYPAQFPMEVLDVMRNRHNVCTYLDIALQHISDPVLHNMRRHINRQQTLDLIAEMRSAVPGLHLRTTLMTGFPGEGDKEFMELMDFVNDVRFERMGAFAYCEEENTWAAKKYADSIPEEEKQRRLDVLMAAQEEISAHIQRGKVGETLKVLVDTVENDHYVGRTQWDSPEVDPEVIIEKTVTLKPGEFCNVRITDSSAFELYGCVE